MNRSSLFTLGVAAGLSLIARSVAQADGAGPIVPGNPQVALQYGSFDPKVGTLPIPAVLKAGADTRLWIVQFHGAPTDDDRAQLKALGVTVHGYLPHTCHVVRMDGAIAAAVKAMPAVRWVGAYEPAYRLQPELLRALAGGEKLPKARYNVVVADKRTQKGALAAKIEAFGGTVVDRQEMGLLLIAELDGAQLAAAARCDEVLWIDRWTEPGTDMNNARIQGGANAIETAAGYTGSGIPATARARPGRAACAVPPGDRRSSSPRRRARVGPVARQGSYDAAWPGPDAGRPKKACALPSRMRSSS